MFVYSAVCYVRCMYVYGRQVRVEAKRPPVGGRGRCPREQTPKTSRLASLVRVAIGGRGAIGERKNEKTRCVLSSRSQQTRTFGKSTRP